MISSSKPALAFAVVLLVLAAAVLFQLHGRGPRPLLQTDILALLPPTERNPLAERAAQSLSAVAGARAVYFVGHPSRSVAHEAAARFASALRASQAFAAVRDDVSRFDPDAVVRFYSPYTFGLLGTNDRHGLERGDFDSAQRLQAKLYSPWRSGISASPAVDPFGLLDEWLATLPIANMRLAPENGRLTAHEQGRTWVLISAELPGSAYDPAVQRRAVHATRVAESQLHQDFSGAELLRAGMVFHADAARQTAEHDVDLIGFGSLAGIVLLLYVVFRSVQPLLLGLLSIGVGIAAGMAATLAVYGELHILTLVFGASLIGEAIDYAIQYFAAHLEAGKHWHPVVGLKRVRPALNAALATSLLGYGALSFMHFPAISQIAVFAFAGLLAAWGTVVFVMPLLLTRPSSREPELVLRAPRLALDLWHRHVGRRAAYVVVGVALLLSAPGILRVTFDDDVRQLVERSAQLATQETKIQQLSGFGGGSQFFLVHGEDTGELLENEMRLTRRLRALMALNALTGYQAISDFVPPVSLQQENRALLQRTLFSNPAQTSALLQREGFREEAADAYLAMYAASPTPTLTPERWLETDWSAPFRHLWLGASPEGVASVVIPQGAYSVSALQEAARALPGIALIDKPASVSRLFSDYRRWGVLWLAIAGVLVWLVLAVRYGGRHGAIVLLPTLLGMSGAVAAFGYLELPFTLFGVMALMLVLGVGVNYGIFIYEGGEDRPAALVGVVLSAATTLLSFGLLALSSMPALRTFGFTLAVGIALAVLLSPVILSLRRSSSCA